MTRIQRAVVLLLVAGPAFAQDAPPPREGVVVKEGAFVIEGKVQKPEVVVVVKRDSVEQAFELDLEEDFVQRIVEAVERAPF